MKIEYDKTADAMYLYLSKKEIVKTIPVNESIIIDVDTNGFLVGIELLDISSHVYKQALTKSLKVGVPVFA